MAVEPLRPASSTSVTTPVPAEAPAQRREGAVRTFFREAGELAVFAASSVVALRTTPRNFAEVFRHTSILVRGSTFVIALMSFLISYSVVNFGYYVLRAISATDFLGVVSGIITPRGTTVLVFGYIFSAKVGCGMVSELGAMKVSQETDAYESEGVDPVHYLVGTRLAAAILFVPLVAVVALLAGTAGDYFAAIWVLQGLSESAFNTYHWGLQTWTDQFLAIACMLFQAVVIVIVSCFYGLRAKGGPASVGQASARSLNVNLVLVHLIVPGYLALFYGSDARVPIGG